MSSRFESVRDAAERFRRALEAGGLSLTSLRDFPRGACSDASELLGQYLIDCGLGEWDYISGVRDEPFATHAWLERGGLILDVTADQFADVAQPVWLTSDRRWHRQFKTVGFRRVASLASFEGHDHLAGAFADYAVCKRRADGNH